MKSNKKLIDFEKVVEMFKKDDLVFFLEKKEKIDWKFSIISFLGIIMCILVTSFFFVIVINSHDKTEKIISLIFGSISLLSSFFSIYSLMLIPECFKCKSEDWRVLPYSLCKNEYEYFIEGKNQYE